jgi:hypothetical protein
LKIQDLDYTYDESLLDGRGGRGGGCGGRGPFSSDLLKHMKLNIIVNIPDE